MDPLPDDQSIERRLAVLEARFDAILPTLATKSDIEGLRGDLGAQLERLRAELYKALNDNTKWTMGVVVTMFIAFLGVNFMMFNATRSLIVSQQAGSSAAQHGVASDPAQLQGEAPAVAK